jgi:hypothetical protein
MEISNSSVYLTRYNGRQDFGRFHVGKNKATDVHATTFSKTGLNTQKTAFFGCLLAFLTILVCLGKLTCKILHLTQFVVLTSNRYLAFF